MRKSVGAVARVLVLLPLLAGCGTDGPVDTISNMNPFKKPPQPLPANAQSVLAVADPAAGIAPRNANIGGVVPGTDWPQSGGTSLNDRGNVSGALKGVHYWSIKAGASGFGSEYMGMSSSRGQRISSRPVAAGSTVYVLDAAGQVSGYGINTGGAAWHVGVYPNGQSKTVSGGGLAYAGGHVFVSTGYGELLSIDATSSNIQWRVRLDAPARSAPAIGGGKLVVVSQSGVVQCFDQATGNQLWKADTDGSGTALLGSMSPAVTNDTVIVPGGGGQIVALDLATGADRWRVSIASNSNVSAVSGLRDVSASPVVHDGTVYATSVGGTLAALSLKTGDILWQQQVGSAETPVVSGDSLFLVDLQSRMIAIDRAKGAIL